MIWRGQFITSRIFADRVDCSHLTQLPFSVLAALVSSAVNNRE